VPERPIIVFDVNETLLDLQAIRPVFGWIFSDPAAMRLWFAGLITYSEALTLAGVYVPFTGIGGAAQHDGLQRYKMTHHGQRRTARQPRESAASGPFSQVVAGDGFEPS
jgi:hypothetical protein